MNLIDKNLLFALSILTASCSNNQVREQMVNVPFDKHIWAASTPRAGEPCVRKGMIVSIKPRLKSGDKAEQVLTLLGNPTRKKLRADFNVGTQSYLPHGETFYIYSVYVSSDYVSDDFMIGFDKTNRIVSIDEGTWSE